MERMREEEKENHNECKERSKKEDNLVTVKVSE